jgi:hypothetical protein
MEGDVTVEGVEPRKARRVWLVLIGLFLVLISLGLWIYGFYDIAPPDPASYAIEFKRGPKGENALETFAREAEPLRQGLAEDWNRRLADDERLLDFSPGCEESLSEHLKVHEKMLAVFWKFVREGNRPLVYPEIGPELDIMGKLVGSMELLEAGSLVRRSIELNSMTGNKGVALSDGVAFADFAKELFETDGTLIRWLIALTVGKQSKDGIEVALRDAELTAEEAETLGRQMRLWEPTRVEFARMLKVEFVGQVNFAKRWDIEGAKKMNGLLAEPYATFELFQIKPNMGVAESQRLIRPVMQALENGWPETKRALEALENECERISLDGSLAAKIDPNRIGKQMVAESFSYLTNFADKTQSNVAGWRCLGVGLGIRVFELKKGRLPVGLEELVPSVLAEVPEDPVDGLPLRWNASTGRIYSVGKDGVDNGGDFKVRGREIDNRDWGVVYPWWGGDKE